MQVKVINLAKRTDRLEAVTHEIKQFGIADFERFNAVEGGWLGFNHSTKQALQGDGTLLLLEDDCVFKGTIDDLNICIAELPDDWDLLYLGANLKTVIPVYSQHLYKIHDAWTSHAILYSNKGRSYCANYFDPDGGMIYDEWLRVHAQRILKCFICYPMLAVQADGWSDIWFANTTYGIEDSSKHFYK